MSPKGLFVKAMVPVHGATGGGGTFRTRELEEES
jgi:hypothetical protein